MNNSITALSCLLTASLGMAPTVSLARDPPVVLGPAVLMDVLSKDGAKSNIRYQGQPSRDGEIVLTAANGFFDRCFKALDQQPQVPGDEPFIPCSFGSLGRASDQVPGTARWHLWCPEAGDIKATFFMQVPAGEADHPWVIDARGETQSLKVNASDGQSPQAHVLTFTVRQPGQLTFSVDCTKNPPAAETRIEYIRLEGSAIHKASLLRARYRPSAAHGRFFAPSNCLTPRMWVFETVDVAKTGSYSPMTTPFGYFGLVFAKGGTIPAGAGFNFSMWIAGRSATQAPPIEKMACLIGTDMADAQYSTFGGEGTGVKFRGSAYKQAADRTIQALRIEADGDVRTFYGYFYNEPEKRWKLYASAQEPAGRKNMSGTLDSTGSFCEIPGPPAVERSGDVVREIKRRGWFYGSDQSWYRAQLGPDDADAKDAPADEPGDKAANNQATDERPARKQKPRSKAAESMQAVPEAASAQRFYYTKDYLTDGWIGMAAGGIESYVHDASTREMPTQKNAAQAVPEYLRPEKTAQLFDLPVAFGQSRASAVAADHAVIDYEITKTGPNSKAVLYYGTVDSRTYPPKTMANGSAVEIDMYRPQRTWQSATPEQAVTTGLSQFKLAELKSGTTYYYRLFVAHDHGKSWDYRSGSFKTP